MQEIHLHCLNDTMEDVDLQLGYFSNTHFGYSLIVAKEESGDGAKITLQSMDVTKLLLDSDAPFFSLGPSTVGHSCHSSVSLQ